VEHDPGGMPKAGVKGRGEAGGVFTISKWCNTQKGKKSRNAPPNQVEGGVWFGGVKEGQGPHPSLEG